MSSGKWQPFHLGLHLLKQVVQIMPSDVADDISIGNFSLGPFGLPFTPGDTGGPSMELPLLANCHLPIGNLLNDVQNEKGLWSDYLVCVLVVLECLSTSFQDSHSSTDHWNHRYRYPSSKYSVLVYALAKWLTFSYISWKELRPSSI